MQFHSYQIFDSTYGYMLTHRDPGDRRWNLKFVAKDQDVGELATALFDQLKSHENDHASTLVICDDHADLYTGDHQLTCRITYSVPMDALSVAHAPRPVDQEIFTYLLLALQHQAGEHMLISDRRD